VVSCTTQKKRTICTSCQECSRRCLQHHTLKPKNTPHEFLAKYNVKSYKTYKTARGEKMIIGFFEKLADWEAAKKDTFQFNQQDFRWSKYSPPTRRQQHKKKETSSKRSSKPGSVVDGPNPPKNSSKKQKTRSTSKKQDVIADVLKLLLSLK
jgi:hypothetical protein